MPQDYGLSEWQGSDKHKAYEHACIQLRLLPVRTDTWSVPVDLKGVCLRMPLKPLAENQLEDISSLYVFLGKFHSC